jgi:hypothetical protein
MPEFPRPAIVVFPALFSLLFSGIFSSLRAANEALPPQPKPPYRVLYSNDLTNIMNCPSPYRKSGPFRDELMRASVDETAGVGIDVHMLQPGLGWVPWWPTKILPMTEHVKYLESIGEKPKPFEQYVLAGGDLVGVFVDQCRKKGVVPFISLRVNDTHHVSRGMKVSDPVERVKAMAEFKLIADHPDWLLGPGADSEERTQYAFDFGREEIRDYKLSIIRELCENYDIDGLELDLMRHWRFFHVKKMSEEQRVEIMTGFIRDVRSILDATSKPGRRRLLGVRVSGYVETHRYMGIDLAAMAEAGLDFVNASGHYFTDLQMDIGPIRKMLPDHVAVYTELHFTNAAIPANDPKGKFYRRATPQQLYTAAHLAYARGSTGVSTFNFQYYRGTRQETDVPGPRSEPPFGIFKHLRDPEWLARQPQQYVVGNLWNGPLKPGRPFREAFSAGAKTEVIRLDMAPPTDGWKKGGRLRIQGRAGLGDSQWTVRLNGTELAPSEDVSDAFEDSFNPGQDPTTYRAFQIDPQILRDGVNEIELAMVRGSEPAFLYYLDLNVE